MSAHYLKNELYALIREDESIFEFIQKGFLDGIWYWDLLKPENEWMSPRFWEIFGYDPEEMPHSPDAWQDIINQDDLKVAIENFNKHCEDPNHPYDQIVRYRHKDGSIVWIRCRGIAIRDDSGKPLRMLGAHTDITKSMEQKTALAESEERFKLATEGASVGIWDWLDVNKDEEWWSPKFYELLGYKPGEIKSSLETFRNLLHPDDMEKTFEAVQECFEGDEPFQVEYRLKTKSGSYRWFFGHGTVTRDAQGNPIRMVGSIQDIDKRKLTELNLAESEERFKLAAEGSSVGIWDWFDLNREVNWWSPKIYELLGYEEGEIPSTFDQFKLMLHPDDADRVLASLTACLETDEPYNLDFRIQNKGGLYRWYHATGKVLRDENGNAIRMIGSMQDIHLRKMGEEEIKNTNNQLTQVNSELSNFAYITSHDLREPLRSIASFLQLLKQDYADKLDDTANEYINFAVDGSLRLQSMIAGLLQFSRAERHQIALDSVTLGDLMDQVLRKLVILIAESDAVIDINDAEVILNVDQNHIMLVFQNIIENAIKFRGEEQPKMVVSHKLLYGEDIGNPLLVAERQYDVISVQDNGIGINPEYFDRIFSIFQRLHTTEEYEGSGIGLAICQKIVSQHNGLIWVESEEGKGSCFYVALPA